MAPIKDKLIELIEAYAIAKTTANPLLVKLSASALSTYLDALNLEGTPQPKNDPDDFTTPEPLAPSKPRTSRRAD